MISVNKLSEQVNNLMLDLKGKVVLTEAASGAYMVTPVLAVLAGAKVYAFTKETKYGSVKDIFESTTRLLLACGGDPAKLHLIDTLTPEVIQKADIITNSGHLRPLDEAKLKYAKDTVVIPLMYEAWERRETDIDMEYARKRGFKVAATNERHEAIDVFNYLGHMAIKFIFDAGLCTYRNRFILLCNNDFGPYIAKVLASVCHSVGVIDLPERKEKYDFPRVEWLSDFPQINIPDNYRNTDAVIFTASPFQKTWMTEDGELNVNIFKDKIDNPFVLRFAGDIDEEYLNSMNIRYYPEKVKSGHMGIIPSEIGDDSIIRLQSGGLKVGEALFSGEYIYQSESILEIIE